MMSEIERISGIDRTLTKNLQNLKFSSFIISVTLCIDNGRSESLLPCTSLPDEQHGSPSARGLLCGKGGRGRRFFAQLIIAI